MAPNINTTLARDAGVFDAAEVMPEALINQITTFTVPVEGDNPVIRVPYAVEDPEPTFVPEGHEIPWDSGNYQDMLITTKKLAVLKGVSREAIDANHFTKVLQDSMSRAMVTKANTLLLQSSGAALPGDTSGMPAPVGLINSAGYKVTETESEPQKILDMGEMTAKNLDLLTDAITAVSENGASPSHIVMDPKSWGALQKLKTQDNAAALLLGSPAAQTEKALFGVPVIVSPQMAENKILVLDKNNILSSYGGVKVEQSDQVLFNSDSIAYRLTWRMGWAVIRHDRMAKITVKLDA